jgi:peptide/nickel transport system substrate-binding protein
MSEFVARPGTPARQAPGQALRRQRRRRSAAAGLAVLALAAAGCAGSGATSANGQRGTGAGATAAEVGSTLTIADTAFPTTMDPAGGQNAYNQYYDLAYDPLIVQTVSGGFAPGLATSWSYGADNESFSFTLRTGVRFSDGTAFNADAVKTWIQHELKVPGGAGLTYLDNLTTIDVTSPTKLTLHFSKPTPQLPLVFSQALEMGEIGSPKEITGTYLATHTDGAGEYVLDSSQTVVGDHYTFTPNPYYWNPKAIHWKKIVIRVITNPTTTLQAMQSGQVQFAVQQQVSSIPAARADGFNVTMPLQAFYGLAINDRTGSIVPALGKVQVRQAINYALNREALNKAVYAGYGQPNDEIALPGDDGYVPSLASRYTYDPAKARQLLAEAGYPHGFTMHILDVAALGFDTLAEAISGELAAVGIKAVPVTAANIGDYFGKLASGKYETSILGFGGLPGYFLYDLLIGPHATQFNPLHTTSSVLTGAYNALLPLSAAAAAAYSQQMVSYVTGQAWFAIADSTPFVAFGVKGIAGSNAETNGRREWYLPELHPAS